MSRLPSGTVTFLFTDIEGSTRLWEDSSETMAAALARHDELLLRAFERHGGQVFATSGDGFSVAFHRAQDAVAAALEAQLALMSEDWAREQLRVRMAVHTGEAEERRGDYFGPALNETGRLLTAGAAGQVLVSAATREVLGPRLAEGVGFRDLGEHSLRDVIRPMRLFQLIHPELLAGFPPPQTLDALRSNLPVQVTSFVGRHQELAEVDKLIRGARLVTLTGAGGCGKTRLAIETASGLFDEFADVWFVDLAPVTQPGLVASTVARAMGMADPGGQDPVGTLVDSVAPRSGLLVVDNCEHLLDAVRPLVAGVLRAVQSLRVLATSGEPLGLQGEVVWALPPLETPDGDVPLAELRSFDAIRLFEERADAVCPGFRLTSANGDAVRMICRRLDGIPLGVELAAARLRVLSPEDIADRLGESLAALGTAGVDVAAHHRTLEATLEWSHRLVELEEQTLLARLAVFSSGWTLDAAEHVAAGDGIEPASILDLLGSLVDKSLVVVGDGAIGRRYRLLEPVRQFAQVKLNDHGEGAAVRQRHAFYFAELVEKAFHPLAGPDAEEWLVRLEAEVDNLRQALEWHLDTGHTQAGQLMAGALYRFWARTRRRNEAEEWRDRMLAADDTPGQPLARTLLIGSFFDGYRLDDAIELYRRYGPPQELAIALTNRASYASLDGDWQLAIRLYQEAGDGARSRGLSGALQAGAIAKVKLRWEGDIEGAAALAYEAVAGARSDGSLHALHTTLQAVGDVEMFRGNFAAAIVALEEALELEQRPGARMWYVGGALAGMAEVAYLAGDLDQAVDYLDQLHLQIEGLGYGEPISRARREAHSLRVRGETEIARRNHRRGVVLLAADTTLRASEPWSERVLPPPYQRRVDAALAGAKAALGDEAFDVAWSEGAAMTLEEALRYGANEPAG